MSDSEFNLLGSISNSRETLNEVLSRRDEQRESEPEPPPSPPAPAVDYSRDLDALRSSLANYERENRELRGLVERTNGSLSQLQGFVQQGQRQQPQYQEPEIQVSNPELAAALAAHESRINNRLSQFQQHLSQAQMNQMYEQEVQRFESAMRQKRASNPDFAKLFTEDAVRTWSKGFLQNPQFARQVTWDVEFDQVTRANLAPSLQAELAEAKKKLAEYEKAKEVNRAQQKDNLHRVPSVGQRSDAASTSGVAIGSQILADFRKNGKKGQKRPSMTQFGNELGKRLGIR